MKTTFHNKNGFVSLMKYEVYNPDKQRVSLVNFKKQERFFYINLIINQVF
ncbi:hypothetical protein SAMN05421796_10981 [Chryseobacterium piscicola]|uniref:Uncharacterized protein n=1 Tax=Chryseobacterium piscicola TaxID=551459 RepID=A0A1N7NUI7_9FLAO|nr:hypothetical protein SAMN05421796_10981 [Chryseobacterium piscicola]